MLAGIESVADATALSEQAQRANNRIAECSKPIVAAIEGSCLGGGLELALACTHRVAADTAETKIGLPEVQLGLLPGAGGTQRLPTTVGVEAALDLMLTGKRIGSKKAKRIGLVDEVVPAPILEDVAAEHAISLTKDHEESHGTRLRRLLSREQLRELALAENPVGRMVVFEQAKKRALEKTKGNYPAPLCILEAVQTGLEKGLEEGLAEERKHFGELLQTPESRELIYLFHASKEMPEKRPSRRAKSVERVSVLGTGLMGTGVAYVTSVHAGLPVRFKGKSVEDVRKGMEALQGMMNQRVKRKKTSSTEAERLLTRVAPTTEYIGFSNVDIVIEAVFENLELKREVLREVEATTEPDTIFASNTSSLPITAIAEASARPETVIGMHYFSPVEKMPLLEIVVTDSVAPWVVNACVALGKAQGKTVIVVRDGVGFYTTRILAPFLNEAAHLLEEIGDVSLIDRALSDFGFPVGPLKLTDEIGIDVASKVSAVMEQAYGKRLAPPAALGQLVSRGLVGRKTNAGFYDYSDGSNPAEVNQPALHDLGIRRGRATLEDSTIAERCVLQMINEAARCFSDGTLISRRDGDIGAVFGLGFPPFLGGPFRYIDAVGARKLVDRLDHYRDECGERFEAAEVLRSAAKENRSFPVEVPARAKRNGRRRSGSRK